MKRQRTRHRIRLVLTAWLLACSPTVAFAQDALSRAKNFYQSADYEAALNVLDTLRPGNGGSEAAAYRVFCLVALGRRDEAKTAVETIVRMDPLFRPDESQASPRLRSFFDDARKPLLPDVARQVYANAKAAFDGKDWPTAASGFDRMLQLLDEIGDADRGASDLRTLASGFRDLARASIPPPPPPAPEPTPAPVVIEPPAPKEPEVYGVEHSDVKKPVSVVKTMPDWRPDNAWEERQKFTGALELVIDEAGRVTSARLIESVHPRYDADLVKAAANWTFRPATLNGTAVRYRYVMAVQLGR
jgi:TonB family protein